MSKYREGLPRVPDRMRKLPIDHRGYPVPWFTPYDWDKGDWNFQAAIAGRVRQAATENLCWICGGRLPHSKAFVIGPMCAINRTSSEPPSHRTCAEFALLACPFLTKPRMRRAPKDEQASDPGGVMFERNPGVALLWITPTFRLFRALGGDLIEVGDPVSVEAWAEGRRATPEEVEASIESGLPALIDLVETRAEFHEVSARLYRACELLAIPMPALPACKALLT